ncbi:hypothetical protein [Nocardioides sp.]|uniref:hypothetical protein n=1 Tax=Nocardioides sp. TaxID=35761 RepID=UPI003563BE86
MSTFLARAAVLAATTISAVALSAGSASATPACADPVVNVLHLAHDTTGDPAGAVHAAEATYCGVKP